MQKCKKCGIIILCGRQNCFVKKGGNIVISSSDFYGKTQNAISWMEEDCLRMRLQVAYQFYQDNEGEDNPYMDGEEIISPFLKGYMITEETRKILEDAGWKLEGDRIRKIDVPSPSSPNSQQFL